MNPEQIFFTGFIAFILLVLAIDLGIFNRKSRVIGYREAISWTTLWVVLSFLFYGLILWKGEWIHGVQSMEDLKYLVISCNHSIELIEGDFQSSLQLYKQNLGIEFLTGYIIEKSLSVDNIFVIIMIFHAFGVNKTDYHKVLFWGILGALVMRFLFIFLNSALIYYFEWLLHLFGGFLIFTGFKMFFEKEKDECIQPQNHPIVKLASKYLSVFPRNVNHKFFFVRKRKPIFTPLFVVLLVVEFSDVLFAVDSIPAIFSVTQDPYIVYFSNIFAILGLRSLFFLLINVIGTFCYLQTGLSVLLIVIGLKMLAQHYLEQIGFTTVHSLLLIVLILGVSILMSVICPIKNQKS